MRYSGYPKEKTGEQSIGAVEDHCKIDIKNRFLMLLVYYRLYITHTLAGFLFDLDQSSICMDIQKIEPLVRKCLPIPQKMHKTTKRLRTPEKRLKSTFQAFCPSQTAQSSRYQGLRTKQEEKRTIQARGKGIP